ncbi:uncharacterized protein LOC113062213 isoform X2 [Carassius auratus]|uniref:Uncharacterized protein LOC113062213 isoform X2 n=1 Tax=Carassius auratus TaxID=7957 RepID=A0A6P6LW29_CARAU|nr:uncharacterized protein LOC113062213 isoform X2 [Carassius auratus]
MASQTINFITWNVNGLRRQRDQKFQELQNADVVFLQETHIGVGDIIELYKDEWHIFYTKYTSSSKGTAILVRKSLDFEHISDEKDNCGAYVVLKCKLKGQPYTLVSVYNHHTDTKTLDKLSRYLQSMTTGLLVIGGDFNTALNRFIDKKWNKITKSTHSKLLLFVEKFMKSLQLVDIWRRKNPMKQDYTYYIRDSPVSRLDYFFIPEECMWRVKSCDIRDLEMNENKDHQPVFLEANISAIPFHKVCQTQSVSQWRNLKKDLTCETSSLLGEESPHAVSEVDIVSAVNSLQVSDTPRPDGIPVSFYKDNMQDLIPFIKMIYDRIHRGVFNCSEKLFNETVKSQHDDSQHFFNVDFLIIATILAKRLEDVMESLPKGQIPKDSATLMITPKTHYALISLSHIKDELEQHKNSNPTLSQDLLIIENLLNDAEEDFSVEKYKVLHQSCPLTPGLITLALKSYASQLFDNLENFGIFIFKQSVIVCFQPEDLDNVKATVKNSVSDVYEMEILSRGNGELLQLNCSGNDFKDEDSNDWYIDTFQKNEEKSAEICTQLDERDAGTECDENESMDVDLRAPKEEMEAYHGMKKNTPPLLPVPSQSRTSKKKHDQLQYVLSPPGLSIDPTMVSQGIKRKRDHESSDMNIEPPLTTDMIMENARQILKRVAKNSDQINIGSRKKATIGIFGKSGEGKSSLLSAVLGKKNLLPSGCFGACTAVVTQVEANLNDSNYKAEIELFSQEEWENELKDLFINIKDDSEDRNEDLFEIAKEKIKALYGVDANKKTLEELKNNKKFAEIKTFLSISKKIISNSNLSEFTNDVASYIQHSELRPGDWYWPLVKSVTIMIPDCRELLEHIVLLDLPGTGDCNKIRDDLWKSKLRECSSVWIVSDIKRATTDRDPWGILKHCIEELGPGGKCKKINFICTKTDDINTEAYIRCANLKIDTISEDKGKTCILHRNDQAKTIVKEKFEDSEIKKIFITDNQFQVFTVSSNAFFDHSLNLESSETEIPKLQDDLRNLNKSINRELTRDYVNKVKGTLLLIQSGQLDPDKKMIEMKVNTLTKFEENLRKSLIELDKYFDNISNVLEQHLSNGVDESVQLCVASTKAMIAPNKDGRGFHKILGALCKNYGCYWSKNRDVVRDLNKTLAKYLHKHIDEDFYQIFPVTGKTGKSVQEQIDKFSIIQSDSAYPSCDILDNIQNFIKIEETKLKEALNRDIVDMKMDIYSSIKITILNQMASCYQQAAAVTGIGSMKMRQELLISTVDKIKQDMFNEAKVEVLKKLNNLKLDIKSALETGLQEAIERSKSKTSNNKRKDVSREIEQLERLLDQLYD